jgi:hypothetical protein
MNTRSRMKQNAKAYNKHLTDEQLDSYNTQRLLALTHPLDRSEFAKELGIPVIEKEEEGDEY